MPNIFSVPIFFIVFRETLEAAIIISVLLGIVEKIASTRLGRDSLPATESEKEKQNTESGALEAPPSLSADEASSDDVRRKRLLRKLRIQVQSFLSRDHPNPPIKFSCAPHLPRSLVLQIFIGSGIGLLIALAIGAAFIAVWFTKASDLWTKSEALWEGIFSLIASTLIFVVGITMLKMDKAKVKWRIKLQDAFDGKRWCLVFFFPCAWR